jgi:hypothetical protein
LNNFAVLKSSESYELSSEKISVIVKVMGLYEIVILGIDRIIAYICGRVDNLPTPQGHELLITLRLSPIKSLARWLTSSLHIIGTSILGYLRNAILP